ncbi:MAG: riboflavin biosynthesis protein RibF [Clostridia bacterium]|nr:riboflavin biosynthesis protein RibF [Clostridia bacterium]
MTVLDLQDHNRQLHIEERKTLSVSVCLGYFDGVHIGHAALLKAAYDAAVRHGIDAAVWTFSAPPFPGRAKQLTTLSEKLSLFASHGIRYAFLYEFNDVRDLSPEDFVEKILIGECHVRSCVCGFNFRFAKNAQGTTEDLRRLLSAYNADLDVLEAVTLDGLAVSATRIRGHLSEGDTVTAARCLGRNYAFTLPVVHGKALGRTIGVPTINQNPPTDMQLPANGTYATTAYIDGMAYPAVTNIGIRPTVTEDDHLPNAETHIIGYDGCLYDRSVTVAFRRRLRDEMRFDSLDALKAQIADDIRASVASYSE